MRILNILTVILILFLSALLGGGRDIYVAPGGTNGFPYTNWPDAATNIQWAVNVGTNGDTVWISNGTYVLTSQVTIISNLTISGLSTNNRPVVDGNNAVRCFYIMSNATVTLSNLFITRGYAAAADSNGHGAGVYMSYGTVQNCVFSNNVGAGYGGGMYIKDPAIAAVRRCTFIANAGYYGGGLFLQIDINGGTAIVDHCVFQTNIVGMYGGGLYGGSQRCVVTGSDFICNVATGRGGGISSSYGLITHCTVISNVVNQNGGGIYYCYVMPVTNCVISWNIAQQGGGLASCIVRNCVISNNSATSLGGGMIVDGSSTLDSVIVGNYANDYAGGVQLAGGGALLQNCLIMNNGCGANPNSGGGVQVTSSGGGIKRIKGCTIASNYSGSIGGGLICLSGATSDIENTIVYFNQGASGYSNYFIETGSQAAFSNCCLSPEITNSTALALSTNNITSDPRFVDRASGNYRLSPNSPCVNAGINRDWMTNAVDLEGRKRIRYRTVDMGVYEVIYDGTIFSF